MIIFTKKPDGSWEKSGEIYSTETHYRIAVDANDPEANFYKAADAVAEVEDRIAKGTEAYRFELAMPPKRMLNKARAKSKRILKKVLKRAGESAKARRARLKKAGICADCGKRKASKGFVSCGPCRTYYRDWEAKARKGKR